MKLRNKETGKVQTCDMVVITDEKIDGEIASLNKHTFIFRSIEQFNDEYEAYAPKEPLIKDEKVRKAVRTWAEASGIEKVLSYGGIFWIGFRSTNTESVWKFECNYIDGSEFQQGKEYTIAELCGDEEE